ncbi:hypothetical protein [Tychonema sp. BBK16]|uniref:hypothetical protein n=1 Tax=Tychonema sp. BBK16 TaxID=2699888 RepID=UPI001F24767F|nr:hypothetical protein [Tychonema sp. BBK16]MCF6372430.1 hypothetical protein [Tychonema sp. BBK16]
MLAAGEVPKCDRSSKPKPLPILIISSYILYPKMRSPLATKPNLYNKDGKYNTTYTVCHNTAIAQTPYIRKSKEKQSTTVAVQKSCNATVP